MQPNRAYSILTAVAMLPLSGAVADAQQAPWLAGAGVGYEMYSFADADKVGIESISLATFPFAAQASIGSRLMLGVSGAYANGSLIRSDGTESTLSGLTDTGIQVSVPVLEGSTSVVVTGVVTLPTGISTLTREEADVAGVIAADLLPFRISNWGSGLGTAGQIAVARQLSAANFGVSVSYRVASEFEPLVEPEFGYQPGNELRVRFAADRTVGAGSKLSAHLTYHNYGDDQIEGQNLFQSGDRVQLIGAYAFPVGAGASGVTYAGFLHRTEGTAIATLGSAPLGVDDAPAQTLFLIGSAMRRPLGGLLLVPAADLRVFRREDGVGQGYVLGVGTSAEYRLGGGSRGSGGWTTADRGLVLIPTLRLRLGNLLAAEDAESRFTGADVGLSVRFGG